MEKIANYKIPTKRRIVEAEPEVEHIEESSSASTSDLPASEDEQVRNATEEEKQAVLKELLKKNTGNTRWAEECWKQMTVENVKLIFNQKLKRSYEHYKRKHKITTDVMGYRVVYDTEEINRIAREGQSVDNDILIEIGDPLRGVVIFDSPAMAYAGRYLYANIPICVMMYKIAVAGKRNEVTWGGQCLPSKNHTSHVLMKTEGIRNKFHRYLLDHYEAAVYHYEYLPNKMDIQKYPSMILPYAVITYVLPLSAYPSQSPPKPSKINKSLMYFGKEEFCEHTLVFKSREIQATVCLPSFLRDVPYILHKTRSTPVACCMDNLSSFPELQMLRRPECFGKMLSTDSVLLPDSTIVTYYLLRFSADEKDFVDLFRKRKLMLVWTKFPFTVFYIPSGDISAEFGLPHLDNYMHLIVHRTQQGPPESKTLSMFTQSVVPLDYALYWNKPAEYSTEAVEETCFEDAVFEDDYGDEEMEQREREEEKMKRESHVHLKGILKMVNSCSRRLTLRWNDETHPNHTPGNLIETRYFLNDRTSPDHEEESLSFDEKRKREEDRKGEKKVDGEVKPSAEEKDHREHDGSNELFKNAMAGGTSLSSRPYDPAMDVPYSPDYKDSHDDNPSLFVSPTDNTSPMSESSGNTNTPSSLGAPSPDQSDFSKTFPQSFSIPPPNFNPRLLPPSAVSFIPNLSVPPPPIPRIAPSQVPQSSHRLTPPPPGTSGAPSNHLPAPSPIPLPIKLSVPNVHARCLVPDSGPPKDPRIPANSSSQSSRSSSLTKPSPSSFNEEQGEAPMDVDEEESSSVEVTMEDDNDILRQCYTPCPVVTSPKSVPPPVEAEIQKRLEDIRERDIMGKIKRKKLESDTVSSSSDTDLQSRNSSIDSAPPSASSSQDTDLRVNCGDHVNFKFNKVKPSVFSRPNALRRDSESETEEDEIPLPPGKAPSSSSQDVDYRKLQPTTSRTNNFTQDRDDRLTSRFHDIIKPSVSGVERRKIDDVQERLRIVNKKVENSGFCGRDAVETIQLPASRSGSVGGFFPNIMKFGESLSGLRGALSMGTSEVSREPKAEQSTQSIPLPGNSYASSSASANGSSSSSNVSSSSFLTKGLKDMSIPPPTIEKPKVEENDGARIKKNNGASVVDVAGDIEDDDIQIIEVLSHTPKPKPLGKVLSPTAAPPGITKRDQSAPNQNQKLPLNEQGAHNSRQKNEIPENWMNKLTKFSRADITNLCIFLDFTPRDDGYKWINAPELGGLFEKLNGLNKRTSLEKPLIESKVYIHHSSEWKLSNSNMALHCDIINSYKNKPISFVQSLPVHMCDSGSLGAIEELLKCIADINIVTGGTHSVYLTENFTESSPTGEKFMERDIRVMNIRELNQYVEDSIKA